MMLPAGVDDRNNLIYENDVQPIVIRTTERTNFKKCRVLWDFVSANRNNLEPVRQSMSLVFGIAIHKGLETYYNPQQWNELSYEAKTDLAVFKFKDNLISDKKLEAQDNKGSLSEEREEEYNDHLDLGEGMLRNYGEWAPDEDEKLGLVPLAVEEKFQVPLYYPNSDEPVVINDRPVVYQVRIDLVARHEKEDGLINIWDHKTAANIGGDTSFLDLDTQLASYGWAYQVKYGERIGGIMYNELAKSYPKPPKVLKAGNLSQDKRQNTTYELYVKAIEEMGLDPEPYSAMLDHLAGKGNTHFRRTPIFKTTQEIYNQGRYVVDEVLDMTDNPRIYPNPSKMHCGYCAFQGPCNINNEGGDVQFVLGDSTLFRTRRGEDMADAAN